MQVPLGYKRGFWEPALQADLAARYRFVDSDRAKTVVWNFAGQTEDKPTRVAMLLAAQSIPVFPLSLSLSCFVSRSLPLTPSHPLSLTPTPTPTHPPPLSLTRIHSHSLSHPLTHSHSRSFTHYPSRSRQGGHTRVTHTWNDPGGLSTQALTLYP